MKRLIECDVENTWCLGDATLAWEIVETLMRAACRHCKSYASDLYYSLGKMTRNVEHLADRSWTGVYRDAIGLREGGVDHVNWIRAGLQDEKAYRALYMFEASLKPDKSTGRVFVHQLLYRIDAAKMKMWLDDHFDKNGDQKGDEYVCTITKKEEL